MLRPLELILLGRPSAAPTAAEQHITIVFADTFADSGKTIQDSKNRSADGRDLVLLQLSVWHLECPHS